jgi:hypothetical protein
VVVTLGTTNSCAFDNLLEIGPVCERQVDRGGSDSVIKQGNVMTLGVQFILCATTLQAISGPHRKMERKIRQISHFSFVFRFFYESISPGPLSIPWRPFQIVTKIFGDIQKYR